MQNPIRVTVSNGRSQVVGAGGRGFRLEPLVNVSTGNPVEMLVTVRLDRTPWKEFTLTDDAPRHFDAPFETLEIVGGVLGDQWLVTVFDSGADTVGAPARVRGASTIVAAKTTWAAGEDTYGQAYVLPAVNGSVVAVRQYDPIVPPAAFDVSGFTHVALLAVCGAQADPATPGSAPHLQVIAELAAGPEVGAPYVGRVNLDVTGGQAGLMLLGPGQGVDEIEEMTLVACGVRVPYLRVTYAFYDPANGARQPNNTSYIRVVGMR